MIVNLSDDEVKAVFNFLKKEDSKFETLGDVQKTAFEKFSEANNIIESPVRDFCTFYGKKKTACRFLDAEKTIPYIGTSELKNFISEECITNDPIFIDNRIPVIGIQEMYEGDHRYFNLLVETR